MGFRTQRTLVCDRCGASIPADDEVTASFEFSRKFPGWEQVAGDRALCPECAPGYDLLIARHKVELEDYIARA